MVEEVERFKKPFIVTLLLQAGLILQSLCEAGMIALITNGVDLSYQTNTSPDAPPIASDQQLYIDGSAILIALIIVNLGLQMWWAFRTSQNLHLLSAPGLRFKPGWAAGSFVIPIASVFLSYGVMSEIYNASRDPKVWQARAKPAIATLWWIVSLIEFVPAIVTHFMQDDPTNLTYLDMLQVLWGLGIVRMSLMFIMIVRVAGWQSKQAPSVFAENVF